MKRRNKIDFSHEINGFIFNFIFMLMTLFVVLKFYQNILLTTILLFAFAIISFIKWKTYQTIIVFVAGGLIGTIFELVAAKIGIIQYSVAGFFGIPLWLFFFLGNVSIFFYRSYIEIKKIKMKLK